MPSPSEPRPAAHAGGKLQIKVPIIPGLVSYELKLRPDSFLAKLWTRSSVFVRLTLVVGLVMVVALIGLGGWRLLKVGFKPTDRQASDRETSTSPAPDSDSGPPGLSTKPALYAVRVVVVGPDRQPLEGSEIRASAGNEPQRVAGGWEVEIPRVKVPEDGEVTFWAEHPASSARGSQALVLGSDPTPSVQISLSVPQATVRGTVFGPDGRALANAEVSVSGHGDEAAVTRRGGSFELHAHSPPGEQVRLHVEHPDFPPKDQNCWAGSTDCHIRLGSP